MQTFLPDASFVRSVQSLDYKRLGKQRVECKQLLSALGYQVTPEGNLVPLADLTGKQGWKNHPCTKMWRGYHHSLALYQACCIMEWKRRGYNNTMAMFKPRLGESYPDPPWLGDEAVHASHRSNLLRKNPTHYGQFGWEESTDLEYVWPESDR